MKKQMMEHAYRDMSRNYIARLTVPILMCHDDDEILDYLNYPNVTWSGRYEEQFTLWMDPDMDPTPEPGADNTPFGIAEYTVVYASHEDLEADAETRKQFLEGLPDSTGFWREAGVAEVISAGKMALFQQQADQYDHDKRVGNPELVVNNT